MAGSIQDGCRDVRAVSRVAIRLPKLLPTMLNDAATGTWYQGTSSIFVTMMRAPGSAA
jgi:hypothetical protein